MAKKQAQQTQSEEPQETLPVIAQPRLPYHPAIEERFKIDKADWKALVEAIFPAAQSTESVILALSYCKARKLDPFKRCIHIVPIWDSAKRCLVDTVWPGIGELRTTAHRTGHYAGRDKTEFGPLLTRTWGSVTVEFPEWAQVTVYRNVKGRREAYAGPQVYWLETFGSSKDGTPNSMWQKRPRGQIDKCAEAAALRAAFPEEVGNDYIDAEAHIKQVESREVEPGGEAGVEGLKARLAQQAKPATAEEADRVFHTGDAEGPSDGDGEQHPEDDGPPPADPDERDPETEAMAQQQKEKLGIGAGAPAPGKGNGKKVALFS